jgi:hypothetical protein
MLFYYSRVKKENIVPFLANVFKSENSFVTEFSQNSAEKMSIFRQLKKTISNTYSECVCVCVFRFHRNYQKRKAHCGLPDSILFSKLSCKPQDFVKNLLSVILLD